MIQLGTLRGKCDLVVEHALRAIVSDLNALEHRANASQSVAVQAEIAALRARLDALAGQVLTGSTVNVARDGALEGNGTSGHPLAVRPDGSSVIINAQNELEAPGAAGGITQLTGDGTAGPGSGSQAFTLAASGVGAGTYGNGTNVPQVTVDAKGRVTAAANVAITAAGITQLTGDVTAGPGSGSQAATLANTAVTPGTYGDSTHVSQITVDAKGRITSATDVAISASGGSGGPASISVLDSGTAATYTVPASINRILVIVVGAGGGGGGADGQTGAGGGGGAGSVAIIAYDVSPSDTFTYTIGALGTGGSAGNNAGTQGGSTLFDEAGSVVTAVGGNGGGSMAAGSTLQGTGTVAHVVATGGEINLYGAIPERGIRFSLTAAMGSAGASGSYGAGGQPAVNNDGLAASGYGAGGGGCVATTSTDRAGGDGAPGVIFVFQYN